MRTAVTALIVTSGETPYLAATLLAVSRQTLAPQQVFVIDVSSSGVAHRSGTKVLKTPGAPNLGEALRQAKAQPDFPTPAPGKPHALWILHDDSAPAPSCLAEQLKVLESGSSIKVVGAKQRLWDRANQIVEVGIRATRSGRRLQEMDTGEVDQGQYDGREDVLGVGTAGMLVDWETFCRLDGFDPHLGPFGDGLEFSRRVHLAGYRVVVAPRAVMYHKMAGYFGLRGPDGGRPARSARSFDPTGRDVEANGKLESDAKRSFTARRTAQLHNWMVAAPWWLFIFLPLIVLVLGLLRFFWRILTKEPKLAAGELQSTLVTVFRPFAAWQSRLRRVRQSKLSPRTLRPLQVKSSQIRQAKTTARRVAKDQRRPQIADAAARRNFYTEKAVDRTLVWVVAAALTLIGLLGWRFAIGGVSGGALANLPVNNQDFWADLISGWIPAGLGYGSAVGAVDPLGLEVASLGQIAGFVGVKGPVVLAVLLFATLPLAWLSAWWAAGVLTDSRTLRALVALSWALSPNLLVSMGLGQLPVWVLAVSVPLFAGSLARGTGMPVSRTVMGEIEPVTVNVHSAAIIQVGIAALTGFLTVSASVIMVIPVVLLLGMAMLKGVANPLFAGAQTEAPDPGWSPIPARLRLKAVHALIVLAPAVLLAVPTVVRTVGTPAQWPLWLSSLSVPLPTPRPNWWDLLAAWPVDVAATSLPIALPGWQLLAFLPLALLLLTVVVGVIIPGHSTGAHWSLLFALGGLVTAWLASSTPVSVSGANAVCAWCGPGLALFHAGLITSALFSVGRLQLTIPVEIANWSNRSVQAVVAVAVLIPVLGATPLLVNQMVAPGASDFNALATFRDVSLPATVAQGQSSPRHLRALNLEVSSAPNQSTLVTAGLWRDWRDTTFEASPYLKLKNYRNVTGSRTPDAADAVLQATVASVLGGSTPKLGEQLAQLDVNFIIVPRSKDAATTTLINTLDSAAPLERITTTEAGTVWRLVDSAAVSVARVAPAQWKGGHPSWPTGELTAQALNVRGGKTHVEAGPAGRLLAFSERADSSFTVRFNGKIIEPVDSGQWNALYQLPPNPGTVTITYAYLPYQLWGAVLLLSLLIALAAALPLRRVSEVRL